MNLRYKTNGTFTDITKDIVPEIDNGVVLLFTKHTTCGLAILENESLLKKDMESFLERVAPSCGVYAHDDISKRDVPPDERLNGYSHIRSLLFSPSLMIPVKDGKLDLGKWQSVFLVELDPSREREITIQCISQ